MYEQSLGLLLPLPFHKPSGTDINEQTSSRRENMSACFVSDSIPKALDVLLLCLILLAVQLKSLCADIYW